MQVQQIADAVCALYQEVCVHPDPALPGLLEQARAAERSEVGRDILSQLLDNIREAAECGLPLCQDTGMAVAFVDVGQDVRLEGGDLACAVDDGVRRAREQGYLRASVLDPLTRRNTGDNTPAVLHTRIVPGDEVRINLCAKGFGSENMSRLGMLKPAVGVEGVLDFVVESVRLAGANPCPPVVVGVGVGGSFEGCALLAKRALMRPLGQPAGDPQLSDLERTLLRRINDLGIGPMGLGGDTTALAVHVEKAPTHIASLPVAVNMQCHCVRHGERILKEGRV